MSPLLQLVISFSIFFTCVEANKRKNVFISIAEGLVRRMKYYELEVR